MAFGQPITRVRRHQERLLTITLKEVLRHARSVLTPPDRPAGLCDTHRPERALAGRSLRVRKAQAKGRQTRIKASCETRSEAGWVSAAPQGRGSRSAWFLPEIPVADSFIRLRCAQRCQERPVDGVRSARRAYLRIVTLARSAAAKTSFRPSPCHKAIVSSRTTRSSLMPTRSPNNMNAKLLSYCRDRQ